MKFKLVLPDVKRDDTVVREVKVVSFTRDEAGIVHDNPATIDSFPPTVREKEGYVGEVDDLMRVEVTEANADGVRQPTEIQEFTLSESTDELKFTGESESVKPREPIEPREPKKFENPFLR